MNRKFEIRDHVRPSPFLVIWYLCRDPVLITFSGNLRVGDVLVHRFSSDQILHFPMDGTGGATLRNGGRSVDDSDWQAGLRLPVLMACAERAVVSACLSSGLSAGRAGY